MDTVFHTQVILELIFTYLHKGDYLNVATLNRTIFNCVQSNEKLRKLCLEEAKYECVVKLADELYKSRSLDKTSKTRFLSESQLRSLKAYSKHSNIKRNIDYHYTDICDFAANLWKDDQHFNVNLMRYIIHEISKYFDFFILNKTHLKSIREVCYIKHKIGHFAMNSKDNKSFTEEPYFYMEWLTRYYSEPFVPYALNLAGLNDHPDERKEIVEYLIENSGASIQLALGITSENVNELVKSAVERHNLGIIEYLFQKYAKIQLGNLGMKQILFAVASKYKNLFNIPEYKFESLRKQLMRFLIEKGANIEETDDEGNTPLLNASTIGHFSALELLLQFGASVKAVTKTLQRNALHLIILNVSSDVQCHCQGSFNEIVQTLTKHGININALDINGESALFLLVSRFDLFNFNWMRREFYKKFAKTLLDNGAKLDVKNTKGALMHDMIGFKFVHEIIKRKYYQ